MIIAEAVTTSEDVVNLYRFVLRRDPEGAAAIQTVVGSSISGLIHQFYSSAEFEMLARRPVEAGRLTRLTIDRPDTAQIESVIQKLGLDEAAQGRILKAESYLEMHYHLLKACTEAGLFDYDLSWLEQTDGGRNIVRGEVWGSDGQAVAGYLLPRPNATEPARVEIWQDGVLIAKGQANRFDHRLESKFPNHTTSGFWIALPQGDKDRRLNLELREASSGAVFGKLQVNQTCFDRGLVGQFEQKLRHLTTQIEALKSDLPRLSYQTAIPLENYGQFYERWLSQPFETPLYNDVEALVLLQTQGVDPVQVEASIRSILDQNHPHLRLAILSPADTTQLYADLSRRIGLDTGVEVMVTSPDLLPSSLASDLVVVLSGRCLAHPDMVAASAAYFAAKFDDQAVYFDEDCFDELSSSGYGPQRVSPRFKPDFDGDLLLQTPYVGSCIAVRAGAWQALLDQGLGLSTEAASQIALRLDQTGQSIGHWPLVMTSWATVELGQADEDAWSKLVANSLATGDGKAHIKPAVDVLGAPTQGRHQVVWSIPPGTKASVIIPTRDRIDLLKPCVESLLAHQVFNATTMEVIIVDHESSDPEVLAYLADLPSRGDIRILPHKGPFNWALKNNLAAEDASGDVLVFLNNDTLVLSKTWLDELTGQALRPGVGAVGCRLVYSDRSLQHGGFVASPRFEGFLGHEGLFQPGHDGGYLGRHTVVRQTAAVTGACMAVAKERFNELGGFEAVGFPVDGNDVDFCFRARSLGYRILYTPFATLYHFESKSRGVNAGYKEHQAFVSASKKLWDKWGKLYGCDPYYNANFDRTMTPFSRLSFAIRLL